MVAHKAYAGIRKPVFALLGAGLSNDDAFHNFRQIDEH